MIHNRLVTVSAAGSRKAKTWQRQSLYWSEFVERLRQPARSTETLQEYLKFEKSRQDDLKDVGGYMAGSLAGSARKAHQVTGRDLLTLDLDNIPAGGTQDVLRRVAALGCGYAIYSTRKHCEAAPRLRVLVPTNRTMTADEYEPVARKLADMIGIGFCDPTTFEVHRLMFWPSCCADSTYIFNYEDKPLLDADGMLGLYANWRNVQSWPMTPRGEISYARLAAKQGVPEEKPGVVGAFCRVYDIQAAMDKFLPDVYLPTDQDNRFTFTGGSTAGGAILYDNGLFLYSHHATDPCSGRLVNSFDLVRLHLFGDLDDEIKEGTPVTKYPSMARMRQLAVADPQVATLMRQERYTEATEAFSVIETDDPPSGENADPLAWMADLEVNPLTGKPARTAANVLLVIERDQLIRGRIYHDTFADRLYGIAPLPWHPRMESQGVFQWGNVDWSGLRIYIEKILGFKSRETVEDALAQCGAKHSTNPVVEYLQGLRWDGVPRLDTLYIDYFGAEDCIYTRAVARKALVAAVARALSPGIKFDFMTVICGTQGIGKSTMFRKLGRLWFSDSVVSFEGKDGAELIQGIWIVEIGELSGLSRSDVNVVKQFLSRQDDQYRAAFGREVEKHPRRCVFFGTTNNTDYLHDLTGNRRFWPVDAGVQKATKSVFTDLTETEIDQLWAEARVRWEQGETLFLDPNLEAEAEQRRAGHVERDPLQGLIEEFLDRPIPKNWYSLSFEQHQAFWGDRLLGHEELVQRDRVCAVEIIRECIGNTKAGIDQRDSRRVNAILGSLSGWKQAETVRFGEIYGRQRGFLREG